MDAATGLKSAVRIDGRRGLAPQTGRVPISTYRVQFRPEFGFRDASGIVPYLARLGVDFLYASPVFAARPGSTHGYDVVDPTRLNPELGSYEDFRELVDDLHSRGMGLLLDIVPNHLAADWHNRWWTDVLERGRSSPYAGFFDIAWTPVDGRQVVLVPLLSSPIDHCIRRGEITLAMEQVEDSRSLFVRYFDQRFPLAKGTWEGLAGSPLPAQEAHSALRRLLDEQHYRLVPAATTATRFAYRRFFAVNDLVAVRVEDEEVFEATHGFLFDLAGKGLIDGVRVDHVDGLRDPLAYLRRLQSRLRHVTRAPFYVVVEKILTGEETLHQEWPVAGTTGYDFINILEHVFVDPGGLGRLDSFYRRYAGVDACYDELSYEGKRRVLTTMLGGDLRALGDLAVSLLRDDSAASFGGDDMLRDALLEITCCLPVYRTYIRDLRPCREDVRLIRRATAAAEGRARVDPAALHTVAALLSLEAGSRSLVGTPETALDLVLRWQQLSSAAMAKGVEDTALYRNSRLVSLEEVGTEPEPFCRPIGRLHERNHRILGGWPATLNASSTHDTKRSEDIRSRLDALSESPEEWAALVLAWSKRTARSSEQALDREVDPNDQLLILQSLLGAWPLGASFEDVAKSDFRERLTAFAVKAAREAKLHTDWTDPDGRYEGALTGFVERLLTTTGSPFAESFLAFQRRIARVGMLTGLSRTLLKVTCPGVPDLYQGTEVWDLSFVDPDNRRLVDFAARLALLDALERTTGRPTSEREGSIRKLLDHWQSGGVKLYVIQAALAHRRRDPELFMRGSYLPLQVQGRHSGHIVAFARSWEGRWALVVVCRLMARLVADAEAWPDSRVWDDTAVILPVGAPAQYHEIFTGRQVECDQAEGGGSPTIAIRKMVEHLPVALLATPPR